MNESLKEYYDAVERNFKEQQRNEDVKTNILCPNVICTHNKQGKCFQSVQPKSYVDCLLFKAYIAANTEVTFFNESTGEQVLHVPKYNNTLLVSESVSSTDTYVSCSICGQPYEGKHHTCFKVAFERLDRLEREVQSLKLENKQLRKEMKWL